MLAGLALREHTTTVAGAITVISGVFFGFDGIMDLVVASSWIDLACFGAAAIAAGSLLDRHGVSLKLRLVKWAKGLARKNEEIALHD